MNFIDHTNEVIEVIGHNKKSQEFAVVVVVIYLLFCLLFSAHARNEKKKILVHFEFHSCQFWNEVDERQQYTIIK